MSRQYTRRDFIEDCVKSYIRNNTREYTIFVEQVRKRRAALFDEKFGQLKNGKKVDEDSFRLAFSIPTKLMNALRTILATDGNKSFGEAKGEMAWFSKKFPEFLIPNKY